MEVEDMMVAEVTALAYRIFGFLPNPAAGVSDLEVEAAEYDLGVRLPESYRTLLRHFGAASRCCHEFFGLPRDGLWGDIVLMNAADRTHSLPGLVKFTLGDDGLGYYLDTTRMDAAGECPVVRVHRGTEKVTIASTFLDFFQQLAAGTA